MNASSSGFCSYNLTHWGRVTHICVSKLTTIVSDNGLSPKWRQAIIWTSAGTLLIGPLGINFSEISIKIDIFSFKKMHFKMSSGNWQPSCLGLSVLTKDPKCSGIHESSIRYLLPLPLFSYSMRIHPRRAWHQFNPAAQFKYGKCSCRSQCLAYDIRTLWNALTEVIAQK